jgi:hypothetical protein
MFVCCECCVLSGIGLYDELITRPEASYRLWCVVVYDIETSIMRRPWPALGCSATEKKRDRGRNGYAALVEWYWQGKPNYTGKKIVPVPLCPLRIPDRCAFYWTQASTARGC